jgi:hypothetical protein
MAQFEMPSETATVHDVVMPSPVLQCWISAFYDRMHTTRSYSQKKGAYPMKLNPARSVTALLFLTFVPIGALAQCPAGAKHVGDLYGEGAYNSNLNAVKDVVLPAGIKLDANYKQATIKTFGGGSDARSNMQASEVPAGLCIQPSGTEDHDKGWAVHSPSLAPATWDGYTIKQFKFSLTLYCTTGSGEIDRTTGGCNVKVPVYAVEAKTAKRKTNSTKSKQS